MDTFHVMRDLIEGAGYECRAYSGRGMYGKQCLGVDIDTNTNVFEFIADLIDAANCASEHDDHLSVVLEALRGSRTDSMGLGQIIYWPSVEWFKPED